MKIWNQIKKIWTPKQFFYVYGEVEIYEYTPQKDITAYELALIYRQPRAFSKTDDIKTWWKEIVPEEVKRHFTPKTVRAVVDFQLKYPWEKTSENYEKETNI